MRHGVPSILGLTLLLGCSGDDGASSASGTGATDSATSGSTSGTSTTTGTNGTTGTTGTTTNSSSGSSSTGTTTGTTGTGSTTGTGGTTGGPVCGAIETFETGKTPDSEIHVDPTGTDAGACGAAASPCATIEYAAGLATAGAAVVVHAGNYTGGGYIADLAGTEAAPIWIGGAAGETTPVISGGGNGLQFVRARYLVLHDLEVTGQTSNGINMDDGADYANPDATRHIVVRDMFIHDIGNGGNQDCLKLSGIDDHFVLDSMFETCGGAGGGSGIDHVGCHDGLIANNLFEGDASSAVQAKGGSANIEIRANTFRGNFARGVNMGGSTGFQFFRPPLVQPGENAEATDIRVIANLFVGGTTPFAYVGCDACLAANNTIIDPENWVFRILQETISTAQYSFAPARNGRFENNLVYFDRSQISTYVNIGAMTEANTFSFANNLWYAHDNPGQSDPAGDLPSVETGGIYGADPEFTDAPNGDYHYSSLAPGAIAGTTVPELTHDRDGVCFLDPPSIGAFEIP